MACCVGAAVASQLLTQEQKSVGGVSKPERDDRSALLREYSRARTRAEGKGLIWKLPNGEQDDHFNL